MGMPWFRMYAEYATDPKVQSMDETFQRRFIMFLCLHCSGEYERLSEDELAFSLRITVEQLRETKQLFEQKRFIDSSGKILNWNKRQYKSDSSTSRVQKHRAEKKEQACNGDETFQERPQIQITDTEPEKNSVRAASPPISCTDLDQQVWSLGVQILGESKSSRSVLGRLVKQYGREKVAAKIGVLSQKAPRPVDPKTWLIGALKDRDERPSRFKTA